MSQRKQILAGINLEERGRLLAFIRKMTRDEVEADDVFQDVFAEFIEAYDLGVTIETVGAWLISVARNKILDRFRRRKSREQYAKERGSDEPEAADPNEWMRNWLRIEIIEAIENLPPEQKEVFVLHELEGKSFEEISRETGVNMNTLLSRKRYAVQNLREYLKEIYDEL